MDPSAPEFAWTSKDVDWLDALEVDTSSESLNNEGAVHFSPRFGFQEPIDPWDSLTYNANASLEPSPMECVDSSASIVSPEGHVSEYKVEESGDKRKVKDDGPDSHNPMLKRVKSSVLEIRDDTQSTDNMYGQAKQNHVASASSNVEYLRQNFPYFETDIDAAAYTTLTESWEFEEGGPFGFEGETRIEIDETDLTYADIDVGNFGDTFTLHQIPIQVTHKSISELTSPECQVEEKESAENCADFLSAGQDKNSEIMSFDVHSDAMDQIPCHNMEHFVPSRDGNLAAGSSASIMDLSKFDVFLSTDIDGNDRTYISDLDLLLLDFNWEENITNIECSSVPGGGACSDIDKLPSAPAGNNPEFHTALPPEVQILPSKLDAHPEIINGVIRCVLNTHDTEVPCNDNADFTLSSRSRRPVSSRKNYQLRGIKSYYFHLEEKPDLSETIPSKRAVYKAVRPDPSKKIPSKKAVYKAEDIEETPHSSGTIQSNILSELGLNLSFIKRRD